MINFGYINVNDDGTATVGSGSRFRDVVAAVGGAGREFSKYMVNSLVLTPRS